jgi:hypothetical protein
MTNLAIRPPPPPLPSTVADLEALRKVFHQPTLNDRVDAIHVQLWATPEYRKYLDAVYDEDAVEGSLATDNAFAAKMIRDHAVTIGDTYVAGKKVHTIVKAMRVVLRRLQISREERAREVAGQIIDMSNGQGNGQSS